MDLLIRDFWLATALRGQVAVCYRSIYFIHTRTHARNVTSLILLTLCNRDRRRATGVISCHVCLEDFQTAITCKLVLCIMYVQPFLCHVSTSSTMANFDGTEQLPIQK